MQFNRTLQWNYIVLQWRTTMLQIARHCIMLWKRIEKSIVVKKSKTESEVGRHQYTCSAVSRLGRGGRVQCPGSQSSFGACQNLVLWPPAPTWPTCSRTPRRGPPATATTYPSCINLTEMIALRKYTQLTCENYSILGLFGRTLSMP